MAGKGRDLCFEQRHLGIPQTWRRLCHAQGAKLAEERRLTVEEVDLIRASCAADLLVKGRDLRFQKRRLMLA